MSGFSPTWLALREGADHRSRHAGLASALGARLAPLSPLRVVDLGSGTGSNLRATAPTLGDAQEWTLVDYDPALLSEAARVLADWADDAKAVGDGLALVKDGKSIGVSFRVADLNRELDAVLAGKPDLVTASALFDLISEDWMKRFAAALATSGACFYTVLTYNGKDEFLPPHPFDEPVLRAFDMHQKRDKGFGPAAGPAGARALAGAFRAAGFKVETGESPWDLKPSDLALKQELLQGIFNAVEETGFIAEAGLKSWLFYRQAIAAEKGARLRIGHTDMLAFRD